MDGLRKKRPIFVRFPDENEKNANRLLIQKGAFAVDNIGNVLSLGTEVQKTPEQLAEEQVDAGIISILNSVEMITAKDIVTGLHLNWKDDEMKRHLDNMQQAEKVKKKNRVYYRLKGKTQQGLFDF